MKFVVQRLSDRNGEKQPCEGATLEKQWTEYWGSECKIWTIEIDSVEQLLGFGEQIILGDNMLCHEFPEYEKLPLLKLYDDYNE